MTVSSAARIAFERLQAPGLVAGLDIGSRRDSCALVIARHDTRLVGASIEHRWLVVDAWTPPLGTRSAEAAPLIAARLTAAGDDVALAVDATGAGDAWVDHLIAAGVIPSLTVVITAAGSASRASLDLVGVHEIVRVTAPRHPGGTGDAISVLGALETFASTAPGLNRPAVVVDQSIAITDAGRALRDQLAGLSWRKGRPDHADGQHDDLAFALALLLWSSGATPGANGSRRACIEIATLGQTPQTGNRRYNTLRTQTLSPRWTSGSRHSL